MRMTEGGCEAFWKRAVSRPRMLASSSWTILTSCSVGDKRGRHLGSQSTGADVLDELVDDGEVHVGFEQGEADLANGVGDVLVGEGALAAEVFEGALEFIGEILKHAGLSLAAGASARCVRWLLGCPGFGQVLSVMLPRWVPAAGCENCGGFGRR